MGRANMTDENLLAEGLQRSQLQMLKELDRVCDLLKIPYCLAFGTCLGAVRHSGFIPWDDDVDVYMLAEDLERLHSNRELFESQYFLQNQESDPEYGLMISRLRDSRTTLIEESETDRDINHGIFIDIYPLFYTSPKGVRAKMTEVSSMVYRLLLYGRAPRNRGTVMRIGASVLLTIIPKSRRTGLMKRCYSFMSNKRNNKTYVSGLYGNQSKSKFPYDWFFPNKRIHFEDMMAPVPGKYDEYLRFVYGDYMQLPPEEKQVFHHDYVCVDFEKSYTEYKGQLYCKGAIK